MIDRCGSKEHVATIISDYVCGHNILNHDLKFAGTWLMNAGVKQENVIDTLYLSPLLFPRKPYHALLKDDKLQTDELNNPLNDQSRLGICSMTRSRRSLDLTTK